MKELFRPYAKHIAAIGAAFEVACATPSEVQEKSDMAVIEQADIQHKTVETNEHPFVESDLLLNEMGEIVTNADLTLLRKKIHPEFAELHDDALRKRLIEEVKKRSQDAFDHMKKKRFHYQDAQNDTFRKVRDIKEREKIDRIVSEVSEKTGVPKGLLLHIGIVETKLNEQIKNSYGAYGPTQIKPSTAEKVVAYLAKNGIEVAYTKPEDLYDMEIAMYITAGYLSMLKEEFGQYNLALIAYSGGPGTLRNMLERDFDIDVGKKDEDMRAYANYMIKQVNGPRQKLLAKKQRNAEDKLRLKKVEAEFAKYNAMYACSNAEAKSKRAGLSAVLKKNGINAAFIASGMFRGKNDDFWEGSTGDPREYALAYGGITHLINGYVNETDNISQQDIKNPD